jgi:TolA-binding protein
MIIQRIGSASLLLVGCLLLGAANGIAADQTTTDQSAAAGADLDQVKREWAETVDALQHYSAAQRDAAVDRAEQTLDAMDSRIEELEARTRQQWGKLTQSAREARETTLQRLRMQRNQAAEWYGGMKHSSAGAWESVKQGFIDSYAVLSDSFRKARDEFGDDAQTPGPSR